MISTESAGMHLQETSSMHLTQRENSIKLEQQPKTTLHGSLNLTTKRDLKLKTLYLKTLLHACTSKARQLSSTKTQLRPSFTQTLTRLVLGPCALTLTIPEENRVLSIFTKISMRLVLRYGTTLATQMELSQLSELELGSINQDGPLYMIGSLTTYATNRSADMLRSEARPETLYLQHARELDMSYPSGSQSLATRSLKSL